VAALLLLALPLRRPAKTPPAGGEASSLERLAGDWLPGSVAFAQTDADPDGRRLVRLAFTRPGNLRPVRLEYLRTWRDSTGTGVGRLTGVITLDSAVHRSIPAWLVVTRNEGTREGRALFTTDSIVVSRDALRLLYHTALERPYSRYGEIRIVQELRGDSVVGRMQARGNGMPDASRPIARRLQALTGPYIVDGLGPVMLGAVDLHAEWTGSADMLGWAVRNDDVFRPVDFRVEGEDVVEVPAGRFDCWRLKVRLAGGSFTWWVSKREGVGVRSIEQRDGGTTRETVLTRGPAPAG
jgi:hypothetical protein